MDAFITWWQTDATTFGIDWLEHLLVLMLFTALVWGSWRIILNKLIAVSEKTNTQWDTIFLEAISTPISVFIWLWPIITAIDNVLTITTAIDPVWVPVTRRILTLGILLWFLLRLVNAVEAYLMSSDKRDHHNLWAWACFSFIARFYWRDHRIARVWDQFDRLAHLRRCGRISCWACGKRSTLTFLGA